MDTGDEGDKGIRILSLDNGGPGTHAQLSILKAYMSRLAIDLDVDECDVYPADYFELMGGVGFGGLIALMLGHLRMNVEETSEALIAIALAVFPHEAPQHSDPKTKLRNLKEAIENMLQVRRVPLDTKLNDKRQSSGECKVVLYAANSVNLSHPVAFRTYSVRSSSSNPTIVEALCATMALPPLFSPVKIGPRLREQSFVGGPISANNPTRELLKEAGNVFGKDKRVAQILSIGSGLPRLLSADSSEEAIIRLVTFLASDCETVASELSTRLFNVAGYLRLNVDKGMEDLSMEDWSGLGAIDSHTSTYLEAVGVAKVLDTSLERIKQRNGTATLGQINHSSNIKVTAKEAPTVSSHYVVREKAWNAMLLHLGDSNAPRQKIFAITGMGGCGKTQMVSYFLQEKGAQFTNKVFVDASSAASIKADLQEWARSLGEGHEQDVWEDALRILAHGSQMERWVLILDNADDPTLKLVPFIPKCSHGRIVITSRNRDVRSLAKTYHLELGEMERDEALSTLLHSAGRQLPLPPDELESAHALISELGCLALALVQAGTYCHQLSSTIQGVLHPYSFTKYLTLFYSGRAALMKRAGPSTLDGYERGVYTTLDLSYEAIPPIGREFLHFASQFRHSDIPFLILEIAAKNEFKDPDVYLPRPEQHTIAVTALQKLLCTEKTWDELHAQDIIQNLRSFSLISTTIVGDSLFLQLHPLVQAWARDMALPSAQEYLAMARQVLTSCCVDTHIPIYRYLLPHIDEVPDRKEEPNLHVNDRMSIGRVLTQQGHYRTAEVLFTSVHNIIKEGLQVETEDTLAVASWLAQSLKGQGKWGEAEKLEAEVLEQWRRILGKEHPDAIKAAHNLALTYSMQGRLSEAEKLELEVLEQRRRILGKEHTDTIIAAANLAATYNTQGRLGEAEKLELEVLEQRRRILGKEHTDTIRAAANLAATYNAQGRLGEAEKLKLEVLEQWRRILGKEHPDTIKAAHNLALTYSMQGRSSEAEELQLEVLEQRRRVLGKEHADTINTAANLAATYSNQGRLGEAEKLELVVLEQRRRILGREHPETIRAAHNLALTYSDQGRSSEAEELQLEVLGQWRQVIGKEHPDTIKATVNLAGTYSGQERWADAESLLTTALDSSIKVLGVTHPQTQNCVRWMAHVYKNSGKQEKAEEVEQYLSPS